MSRIVRFGLGLLTLACVMSGDVRAQRPANSNNEECSMPTKGAFSVGFVAEHAGRHYRCLEIYDSGLKAAGVAWIEVVRENRFVVKD